MIGGTITGTIMTYYYGFLFTMIVNSAIWYGLSNIISKYYWKKKGIEDQKYLLRYAMSRIRLIKKGDNKETSKKLQCNSWEDTQVRNCKPTILKLTKHIFIKINAMLMILYCSIFAI